MKLLFLMLLGFQFSQAANYSQSCRTVGDDYLIFSIESELQLNSTLIFKVTAFEDENCRTPYLHYTRRFTIQKLHTEKIDLQTQNVTYTALTDEVARSLKLIQYCGFKNWKAQVEMDVTGKLCDTYQQQKYGELFYQILRIENNSLKFGDNSSVLDGRSEEKRPQKYDLIDYFQP